MGPTWFFAQIKFNKLTTCYGLSWSTHFRNNGLAQGL